MAKRIRLTITRATEDMEQLDLLHIVGGNAKGFNHLVKHLAVFES